MSSKQTAQNPSAQITLQILSGIGLIAFTGWMVNSWHRDLLEWKKAEKTPVQVAMIQQPSQTLPTIEETATPAKPETPAQISDPTALKNLNQKLYTLLDQSWTTLPTFSNNLIYQVKVDTQGEINQIQSVNKAAQDYWQETPFSNLTTTENTDTSAQFVVVLTPQGKLEVSPWLTQTN